MSTATARCGDAFRTLLHITLLLSILILMLAGAPITRAAADNNLCEDIDQALLNAPYVFKYGLSGQQLQHQFFGKSNVANDGSYNDTGHRPVHITGYTDKGKVRFATKWAKVNGPQFKSRFGLTGDAFHSRYRALKGTYRPIADRVDHESVSLSR